MTKLLNITDSVIGFEDPISKEYTTMTLCEFFDLNKDIGAVQALCITNQLFRTNKAEYAYALLDVLQIKLVSIALQAVDSDEIENIEVK